jgi:hypothetical protein
VCARARARARLCVASVPRRPGVPLQARHGRRRAAGGVAGGTWPEWATCCISAGNERLDNILQEAPGRACLPSRGAPADAGGAFGVFGGAALKINSAPRREFRSPLSGRTRLPPLLAATVKPRRLISRCAALRSRVYEPGIIQRILDSREIIPYNRIGSGKAVRLTARRIPKYVRRDD